jgi:hypothetical protein
MGFPAPLFVEAGFSLQNGNKNWAGSEAFSRRRFRKPDGGPPMRWWLKFKAWLKNTTVDCLVNGHKSQVIDGNKKNLVHQKGGARPVMDYFSGTYLACERPGCEWTDYEGPTQPYRRVILSSPRRSGKKTLAAMGRQDI